MIIQWFKIFILNDDNNDNMIMIYNNDWYVYCDEISNIFQDNRSYRRRNSTANAEYTIINGGEARWPRGVSGHRVDATTGGSGYDVAVPYWCYDICLLRKSEIFFLTSNFATQPTMSLSSAKKKNGESSLKLECFLISFFAEIIA